MKTWKEKLLALMASKGISQSQLARRAGLTRQTVSKLLRSESPSWETIQAVSLALECSADDLRDDGREAIDAPAPKRGRPTKEEALKRLKRSKGR